MIAVLGSANMDLVIEVPRIPRPGETVRGRDVVCYPGGKGANQAVAAARLGSDVALFGRVGCDAFGDRVLASLVDAGVEVSGVERIEDAPTGIATICVDPSGENAIAVSPGANALVDPAFVERILDRLVAAEVVLVQWEIPLPTVSHLLDRLPTESPILVVNPAPAVPLASLEMRASRIDFLTPNRRELLDLTEEADPQAAVRSLFERGVRNVIWTDGPHGAHRCTPGESPERVPAPVVEAVDTTAAGDAFNGALAWALLTMPLSEAVRWATAAGAAATTRRGAQVSLPKIEEVRERLSRADAVS